MTVSQYFNHISATNEQNFFEDIIIESIQLGGFDVYYIPSDSDIDPILCETFNTKYQSYKKIEVYIDNPVAFEGEGDLMSKFGLILSDDLTLRVSRKRFEEELGSVRIRPRGGDMIFIGDPTTINDAFVNGFFEIVHVSNSSPFFQMGRSAVYEFKVSRFTFGQEKFETGIPSVDGFFADLTSPEASMNPETVSKGNVNQGVTDIFADLGNFDEKNPFGDY